jgi:phosphopantetheine--protein transferase-like protein
MKISKLQHLDGQWEDAFFRKTFTDAERNAAQLRKNPLEFFAARFSAKEAVFKSLRVGSNDVHLREIEILNDDAGRPYVQLYGRAEDIAGKKTPYFIHISLSHETDTVTAIALFEALE